MFHQKRDLFMSEYKLKAQRIVLALKISDAATPGWKNLNRSSARIVQKHRSIFSKLLLFPSSVSLFVFLFFAYNIV